MTNDGTGQINIRVAYIRVEFPTLALASPCCSSRRIPCTLRTVKRHTYERIYVNHDYDRAFVVLVSRENVLYVSLYFYYIRNQNF